MTLERKVKLAVIFLVIIVVGGTAGYMLYRGMDISGISLYDYNNHIHGGVRRSESAFSVRESF